MNKEKYIDDIKEIREMMSRSSRFISLSGLSGIAAGISALAGAYAAYQTVYAQQNYLGYRKAILTYDSIFTLLIIALATLLAALGFGIFFTTRKARKTNSPIWTQQTRRLLVNLFIPLSTGGILCLLLLFKGYIGFVAPFTLIFYGLALVNASHFTLKEVKSLGLIEIVLGLTGTYFIGYGLLFWAIGFGILHIVYGIIMQIRYKA